MLNEYMKQFHALTQCLLSIQELIYIKEGELVAYDHTDKKCQQTAGHTIILDKFKEIKQYRLKVTHLQS